MSQELSSEEKDLPKQSKSKWSDIIGKKKSIKKSTEENKSTQNEVTCVVIGDCSGKTSMVHSFLKRKDDDIQLSSFSTYRTRINMPHISKDPIDLKITDTSSKDSILVSHLINIDADVVMIVFAKDNQDSYKNVKTRWRKKINNNVPIILVGNKLDLVPNVRKTNQEKKKVGSQTIITKAKGKKLAEEISAKKYYECSTKTNEGIEHLLEAVVKVASRSIVEKSEETEEMKLIRQLKDPDKKDDECLVILKQIDASLIQRIFNETGETLLHIVSQKALVQCFDYITDTYPEDSIDMISTVDENNRTPLMLFGDDAMKDKIVKFIDLNDVNIFFGRQSPGSSDNSVNLLAQYVQDKKLDFLVQNCLETTDKSCLSKALEDKDSNNQTVLMKTENDELAARILTDYPIDVGVKNKNSSDSTLEVYNENIAHVIARKGLVHTTSALLKKFWKNEDSLYELLCASDSKGNTPLMTSAVHNHGENLVAFLTFLVEQKSNDQELSKLDHILHHKNQENHTLTSLVLLNRQTMLGPYGVILSLEKHFHTEVGPTTMHKNVGECFRKHGRSSKETREGIKRIQKTEKKKGNTQIMIWLSLVFGSVLIPLGTYLSDIILDSLLLSTYHDEWRNGTKLPDFCENMTSESNVTFSNYPLCLSEKAKFLYTLVVMVLPWAFYMVEYIESDFFKQLCSMWTNSSKEAWASQCNFNGMRKFIESSLLALLSFVLIPACFFIWPVCSMLVSFYRIGKYETARGEKKMKLEKKKRDSLLLSARAHLLEVCTESSFAPLLQWYILFPKFLRWILIRGSLHIHIDEELRVVELLSILSMLSSIFSLAWSFSAYKVAQKRGALDIVTNPAGRLVIFLSNLFFVLARLQSIVLFNYSFGPGVFYPGVIFIVCHVGLMFVLHALFSDAALLFRDHKLITPQMTENERCCGIIICNPNLEAVEREGVPITTSWIFKKNWKESMQPNLESMEIEEEQITASLISNRNNEEKTSISNFMWIKQVFKFIYHCLLNGLSNIFLHNFIEINEFDYDESRLTFSRQFLFDFVFLLENIILTTYGTTVQADLMQIDNVGFYISLTVFTTHFLGIVFKCVYYKKIHIWNYLLKITAVLNYYNNDGYKTLTKEKRSDLFCNLDFVFCGNIVPFKFIIRNACCFPYTATKIFTRIHKQLKTHITIFTHGKKDLVDYNDNLCIKISAIILSIPISVIILLFVIIILLLLIILCTISIPVILLGKCVYYCTWRK